VLWRWAAASGIGTSHIRSGGGLQDAYVVVSMGESRVFAAVSDGAGSAQFGRYGAWMACRLLTVKFREWFSENVDLPDDDVLVGWIDELRNRISVIAKQRGSTSRQFASTLVAALVNPDDVLALHIGDSAMVGRRGLEWDVLCRPENGEYASTTYFVTDTPHPRLNIVRQPRVHDAFALFSDGVGELALSNSDQTAHMPFFEPMIRPVDAAHDVGRIHGLSAKLQQYLGSPQVCERTDDDKTLILISGA
jgi:hypothetical protein